MVRIHRSFGPTLLIFTIAVLSLLSIQAQNMPNPLIIIAQQTGDQNTSTVAPTISTPASNTTTPSITATNTTHATNITSTNTTSLPPENVTANVTTVTVVSYITLPPVTRPPSNTEIASWISGGVITGILIGLSVGYAIFAKGVSIRRQQTSGKASGKAEKRKK